MRKMPELSVFISHYDWYTYDEIGYFVPTDKAPPEAIEAMEYCNKLAKRDLDNDMHAI